MTHHRTAKLITSTVAEEQAPATYTTSAELSIFATSPAEFLATRPDLHNLIAGTMVFRTRCGSKNLETLLLQRAPSDSFPLKWEIPAGTADPSIDLSIISVAVRELLEETQLRARKLYCSVGLGLPNTIKNLTLRGEAEDARMDAELNLCLLRVSGLTWAIVTFITDIEDETQEVVLRPDEHVAYAWVDVDEIREGAFRHESGKKIEFVSEAMRMTLLEGFRLRREMAQE